MADHTTDDDEFDIDAFETEIKTWAQSTSPEARSAFASGCAARVLPNIGGIERPEDFTGFSLDLIALRAILTSAVAAIIPTEAVRNSASSAATSIFAPSSATYSLSSALAAANSAYLSDNSADLSARAASNSASAVVRFARNSAFSVAFSAANSALSALSAASSAARSATKLLDRAEPKSLFETSLWMDETSPDAVADNWTTLRDAWSTDPAMAFWIDWYDGLLIGRTPDWDLWHDIVLIEDKHWEDGPKAVAREIEIIQAARDLDGKIELFEAQLLQLASEPIFEGNRDNGGPPLEDHQARLATIQLIQAQLDILKAEADKTKPNSEEDPDPEVILTTIEKLKELVKKHFIIATVATTIGAACVGNIVDSGFERYHVSEAFYEAFEAIPGAATKLIEKLAQRPPPKSATSKSRVDNTPIDI